MKRLFPLVVLSAVLFALGCTHGRNEQTLVILSTNDMHGRIRSFPHLATAVKACRDTTDMVLLVDAGDRWTGNAYVDMAPTPGMPVLELMNTVGYDAATFGNHEFDNGQAHLGSLADSVKFELLCANLISDTATFRQPAASVVMERDGVKIGIVGVVTNYEGDNHPAGNAESYRGLRFPDPQQMARHYGEDLRSRVDVLVLLSHMGDDRDMELVADGSPYDVVIGGHTHVVCDTLINGTLLTQTGKNLKNLGVTRVHLKGGKITGMEFSILPVADYEPDAAVAARVEEFYADEELNRPVGNFAAAADKTGIAQWMASSVASLKGDEIGVYHIGGVRLDSIPEGGIGTATVYDLEPFGTKVARVKMTPEQLRKLIIAKYNDTVNAKESHRIDLYATTPYDIVIDERGEAVDVRFPRLKEGRSYRVAMADYIYNTYPWIEYSEGGVVDSPTVAELLLDELREKGAIIPDNVPRQHTVNDLR